jgi:hypothetical protein
MFTRLALTASCVLAAKVVKEEVLMFYEVGAAGSGPMPSVSR